MSSFYIKRIIKTKLFENFSSLIILRGFSYIFPILIIPFLINTIGIEKYGLISFGIAFAFYFKVMSEFGFNLSSIGHIVANRDDPEKLSEIFSAIINIKLILASTLFIIYLCVVFLVDKFSNEWLLFTICYLQVFATIVTSDWLFRGLENLKQITKITIPIQAIILPLIFILVKDGEDYYWVPLVYGINDLLIGIVGMYYARKKYNVRYELSSISIMKYYLKSSVPFFTANAFLRLYTVSNTVFLGLFLGNSVVGIYSVAEKLYSAYQSLVAPIIEVIFYPYFTRVKSFAFANKLLIFATLLNLVMVVFVYLISDDIIRLLLKVDNKEVFSVFKILLISCVIIVPMILLGYPYMSLINNVKYANISTIIAASIHIVSLLIMVATNTLNIYNVAWMICVTNLICLCLRVFYLKREAKTSAS